MWRFLEIMREHSEMESDITSKSSFSQRKVGIKKNNFYRATNKLKHYFLSESTKSGVN